MKNIGLIGVGKMGLSHLAIANSLPNLNVVSLCDTSSVLLSTLSRGIKASTFSDYKLMVNSIKLDAVIISLPNSLHYQAVSFCLNSGLHVFIEKPFTLKVEDSRQLRDLASEKGLILQVGYVNRFCDSFIFIKKLIEAKVFGSVVSYKSNMLGSVIIEKHDSGWRNDYEKGGGCLNDYGPHCIDLICYFFGLDFKVDKAALTSKFSTQVDDIVEASVTHDDGIKGNIFINWSDPSVRKATNIIEITFENAVISVSKQEVHINSGIEVPEMNIPKGQSIRNITDFDTNVDYYLRGEEFSRQLMHFSSIIDGAANNITCVESALKVDETIADIFAVARGNNG